MSQMIVDSAKIVRQLSLMEIQAVPEELFDVRPDGFNNTVRWNVGHLIYWMDAYMSLCFGAKSTIPATYVSLFNSGTKPADWTETPPSKAELIAELSRQLEAISAIEPGRLSEPFPSPMQFGPLTFNLVGELFNFGLMHEAMHLAVCGSLVKAASARSAGAAAS